MKEQKHTGDVYSPDCPCRGLLDVVSGKWSAMAVESLANGPMRFGQLQRRLAGISPKVLTATLRRLEDAGLIDRVVFAEVPSHVEYSLTEDGRSAVVPLHDLRHWTEQHYDLAVRLNEASAR